jgi:hypothetical protein
MAKSSNASASSFVWNSANPFTETLEMLHEAFGEHYLSQTAVFE